MNPQTLPMPAMNYSASPSPQMVPMAYPPMLPLLDMTSITPPVAPMGSFVPTAVPMMGYSIVPVASNGMPMVGLPQASSSYSSENMQFFLPRAELAFTPPQQTFSISRSCSPVSDAVLPEMYERQPVQEVARERLPSEGSSGSLDSTSTSGTTGVISKKELVEYCLNEIDSIFGDRVQTTGMRGP